MVLNLSDQELRDLRRASEQLMSDVADVSRDMGADDAQPLAGYRPLQDWQPLMSIPCLFWQERGLGRYVAADRQMYPTTYRMVVPFDSGLQRGDRITAVLNQLGEVLWSGVLTVADLVSQASDVSVVLEGQA